MTKIPVRNNDEPVHTWFSLSYANYLVLPRTLLQSMDEEWQTKFVALLEELAESFSHIPQATSYTVVARDSEGKFMKDPVPRYRRGNEYIQPRLPTTETGGLTCEDPGLTTSA